MGNWPGKEASEPAHEQTRELSVHGATEANEQANQETQGRSVEDRALMVPVTVSFLMFCEPSALDGKKIAMEATVAAALAKVVLGELGSPEFKMGWTRGGPSEDTLARVLPVILERVGPDLQGASRCYHVCKPWRRELDARGFCNRTVQLCVALTGGGHAHRTLLRESALRRQEASTLDAARGFYEDTSAFLKRHQPWAGNLQEWLQVASQEPDTSFLSRRAASTAQSLGLPLVKWVGGPILPLPDGRIPALNLKKGHRASVSAVAFSPVDP